MYVYLCVVYNYTYIVLVSARALLSLSLSLFFLSLSLLSLFLSLMLIPTDFPVQCLPNLSPFAKHPKLQQTFLPSLLNVLMPLPLHSRVFFVCAHTTLAG